ncbi:vWA domain-containing protein [Fimbriiglobus ruber]|uniref:vWA domain-containing protein n=1 Tax=Fimbriiglobus ruber TaxID=1908690 RepID=UPI00137B105F|nr:VWA domain-containing protein [Fimbriiglobus ruber]
MGFANPEFLALLPAPVLLVWWWVRRRRPALRYSDVRLFDGLPRGRGGWAKWGGVVLRGLAGLAAVLAAAGPHVPDLTTRLPAEGIAIALVVDVSGSMATPDFPTGPDKSPETRLDAAKQAFRLFAVGGNAPDGTHFEGRPRDQLALVTFAAVPQTTCPLTLNHSVLLTVLDAQKPEGGTNNGTNIGDAIAEGVIRLDAAGPNCKKVLILLSDGEHNIFVDRPDRPLLPEPAAQLAANLHIPVYTIDCGGDPRADAKPEEIKQRTEGREVLQRVAAQTNARAFVANSADDLRTVYREIDALERQPVETFRFRRYHEFYPWCAVAAVLFLAVAGLMERTWWRVGP